MPTDARDPRYREVKRCLTEAERAFARAAAAEHDAERLGLMEEAEAWLRKAELRLARLTDRPLSLTRPNVVSSETRSFNQPRDEGHGVVWRRGSKA